MVKLSEPRWNKELETKRELGAWAIVVNELVMEGGPRGTGQGPKYYILQSLMPTPGQELGLGAHMIPETQH